MNKKVKKINICINNQIKHLTKLIKITKQNLI